MVDRLEPYHLRAKHLPPSELKKLIIDDHSIGLLSFLEVQVLFIIHSLEKE